MRLDCGRRKNIWASPKVGKGMSLLWKNWKQWKEDVCAWGLKRKTKLRSWAGWCHTYSLTTCSWFKNFYLTNNLNEVIFNRRPFWRRVEWIWMKSRVHAKDGLENNMMHVKSKGEELWWRREKGDTCRINLENWTIYLVINWTQEV